METKAYGETMRFIIYLTEDDAVDYTYNLIKSLKSDFVNSEFIVFTYRNKAKRLLENIDELSLISKIISQDEIGVDDFISNNVDLEKEIEVIENKYSRDSIWEYVYQDRTLIYTRKGFLYDQGTPYSRNKILGTIIKRFKIIEKIVQEYKPTHLLYVSEDIGTSISNILFEVCDINNVKVKIPLISKFENYFSLTNDIYGSWPGLMHSYKKNLNDLNYKISDLTKLKYSRFLSSVKPLEVSFLTDFKKQNILKKYVKKLFTLFRLLFLASSNNYYLNISKTNYILDKIKMKYRKLLISKKIKFNSLNLIDSKQKFYYFPLHVEPEFVLLTQSQNYLDQLNVIRNIARKLPSNICLYVKDHPESSGRRRLRFYQEIVSMPNVKLISPNENSIKLIKKSEAVITITGTAGFEAFLHNKKVYTLGNPFYNFLDEIEKFNLIDNFNINSNPVSNETNSLLMIQTIIENSVDVDLVGLIREFNINDKMTKNNYDKFYRFLNDCLNE